MSHATYTDEERLFKLDRIFFISIIIFIILSLISVFINFIAFIIPSIIIAIILLIVREYLFLKAIKILRIAREYKVKPKMSLQKKESNTTQIVTFLLIILPLLALYLVPIPINLSIAIGIVGSWPLSNILIQLLFYTIENSFHGKLYSFIVWEEIDQELYIKEYGFKIK
ncbi:hypothetical protein EWF20_04895 [Sulfolobus sp. S-194]|uniref:hypothetical protein n=1 Tax=Sulfolobus sp. S-194 TaxID=2512240 RepID=UPI001436CFE4|nr:hypothetical protein [Sulfolobus sp. S-194]QIW23558.1 hypothetical protein EWF20_04895 [Sulfolobus sp. S-194]